MDWACGSARASLIFMEVRLSLNQLSLSLTYICNAIYVYIGSITVSSAGEGHGSTFEIRLPMTRSTRLSAKRGSSNSTSDRTTSSSGSPSEDLSCLKKAHFDTLNHSNKSEKDDDRDLIIDPSAPVLEVPVPNQGAEHSPRVLAYSEKSVASSTYDSTASPTSPKQHLLVVDDSAMNRKMLCKALKAHGYLYTEATDGAEAVAIVKKSLSNKIPITFDGILMDYIMPNMDGPTATEEIRKLGYIQPIIGVTGNALQSDIDHFTKHGASRVLIKPVQPKDLREVLEG